MSLESVETDSKKDIAVKVAVRIRPLIPKEVAEGCGECLDVYQGTQVSVRGANKAFTYDHSFDSKVSQQHVYDKCVSDLIKELFTGYNVTILAYGQTGSGKTHSMGTSFQSGVDSFSDAGIIPRAIEDIFKGIEERSDDDIVVRASFVELHKETLYDLLHMQTREEAIVDIREDVRGGIKICGLTEVPVTSLADALNCLENGAKHRVTGSTAMNSRSSRSHAIFSLHLEIGKKSESDRMTAKFHLVDLAGSERAKKTRATGERFKEGVNINKGLLALGNVISALCVEGPRGYIPYRDSKLTRLLQDSLGGNSHCLVLACVSPADSNLEETIGTLRYADRAKRIKNKPIVNRDPHAQEIALLRQQVQELQVQLISSGHGLSGSDSNGGACLLEVNKLQTRIQELEEENEKLTKALHLALDENTNMAEKAIMAEMAREQMKRQLEELTVQAGNTVNIFNKSLDLTSNPQSFELLSLVKDLQDKVQTLKEDQYKREKAIVNHELSRHSIETNTSTTTLAFSSDDQERDKFLEEESPIKGDFGTGFTLKQARMNEELSAINRALAVKEELINKMTTNGSEIQNLKSNHEKSKKEYEEQIATLQKEREVLLSYNRDSNSKNNSSKIAEQRRKRVQELEGQISDLRKKLTEQAKLLTIKGKSEEKVKQLNNEIRSMKTVRVNLIRQMKEDNERFRKWKAQKNREVEKLRVEDRKKQFQIVKMERLHSKQQNVLKRKVEQANAVNKRMMDALALQKAGLQKRMASKDIAGVSNRMKCWLDGEMEVIVVKKQAQKSLEALKEDRKNISEKLAKIKKQIEKHELTPALQEGLEKSKENLEKEVQMRTAQITDIQAKILDNDEETCVKKIVDSIQTMVEMKCSLSHLFQVATCSQTQISTLESEIKDMNTQNEESYQTIQDLETNMKKLEEEHNKIIDKMSREHEEKVLFILRQMPSTQASESHNVPGSKHDKDVNAELLQRLKLQEDELNRLSHLHELLQQKMVENEDLEKRLKIMEKKEEKLITTPPPPLPAPIIKLDKDKKSKKSTEKTQLVNALAESCTSSEEEQSDEEERKIDPDWEKTPLFKKIRQIANKRNKKGCADDTNINVTENSSNTCCGCSKSCGNRQCKCYKAGVTCGTFCKCSAMVCTNRNLHVLPSNETSKEETFLNSSFEITSSGSNREPLTENIQQAKKRRKVSEEKYLTYSEDEENLVL